MKCDLCDLEVKNNKGLAIHLKKHQMTLVDYFNISRQIPKCPYCEKTCKPRKKSFTSTCTDKACIKLRAQERKHSNETIGLIRKKRVDYLQKKTGKTAWERRARKEMSYLENWLGLRVLGTLEPKPGLPPTSAQLSSLLAQLQKSPARAVVRAAYNEPRAVAWLSEQAKIPAVMLPFTVGGTERARDLFSLFDDTIARLLAVK